MSLKVNLIIIFGSQVSGYTSPRSDVDIAVLADKQLTIQDKADISEQTAREMKVSSDLIDLVDLNVASPLLQYSIAQTGRLLSGFPFLLLG